MLYHRGDLAVSRQDPLEVVIAGQAGQGAIFAGIVLAEAAVSAGRFATQTSRTGAAVRSGASEAHVLISETWVDYPYAMSPSVLIAMSQDAVLRHRAAVRPDTIVIFDPEVVSWIDEIPVQKLPVSLSENSSAEQTDIPAGNENMIFLGAFAQAVGIVTVQQLLDVLRRSSKPQSAAEAALVLGAKRAPKLKGA